MKIGFIGAGNMGGAILRGYLATGNIKKEDMVVSEQSAEKLAELSASLGITPAKDIPELVALCDVIIVGVKPNAFETVLPIIAEKYTTDKIVVSMAAGIEISFITKYLGTDAKIVRIMPNTPAMVNEAMVAVCRNENISNEAFEPIFNIFKTIGKAEEVPESLIHCVIGVSGSSPAYTYMYIDALAEAAVKNGMNKDQAIIFAAQAVLGAAKMVLETGVDPVQLRINVCSPGGTTIEAVTTLQQNGFEANIAEGFQAAVEKSKIMTKN